ncbi:uncharacterized protein LOC143178972 [Calliopsis andreniformis]|uniref:uncharacterized protein LOC143178972 n=1 Tax=Calliopsis andreniformis TaxID=337506 RepID=UPI003FCD2FB7
MCSVTRLTLLSIHVLRRKMCLSRRTCKHRGAASEIALLNGRGKIDASAEVAWLGSWHPRIAHLSLRPWQWCRLRMQARTCAAVKRESLRSAADAVRLVIRASVLFWGKCDTAAANFDTVIGAVLKGYAHRGIGPRIASDSGTLTRVHSKNDTKDSRVKPRE